MASRNENSLPRSAQIFGALAVGWVMLDSLLTYFVKNWTGLLPPVNTLLVVVLLVIVITWGVRSLLPPVYVSVLLFIAILAILSARIVHNEFSLNTVGEVVLSLAVFMAAFFAFRWCCNVAIFSNLFLVIGLAYVIVCMAALLGVAPAIFPIVNAEWSNNGVIELRPEVTTDQNFQIFYLLPLAILVGLPFRLVRSTLALAGMAGALFVLAKLQTRSGVLVFAAMVAIGILAPIWTKEMGRGKIILFPILIVVVVAINIDMITQTASLMLARSNDSSDNTAYSRLLAFMFTFQHLADPEWWLPRGTQEFINLFGYLPHSNITAFFVEGGLMGLVMWIGVFVLPLAALVQLFVRRELDVLATLVMLGGVGSLVVQLSLNVPFFKQPWLWAGAVVGTLARVRAGHLAASGVEPPELPQIITTVRYAERGELK